MRRLARAAVSVASAAALVGCATGALSPTSVVDADQLYRPGPPGGAPGTCFHYGSAESAVPPSLLPGDRIQLTLWTAGVQDLNYKNTYPPQGQTLDLRIRKVETPSGHLDSSEQQVLAAFLQLNRANTWTESAGGPAGITRAQRGTLSQVLERDEGNVWNAFVGSLCLRSVPTKPAVPERRVLVLEADMRALCRAVEAGAQPLFARAFLTDQSQPDEYKKGCGAAALAREPMTIVGIQKDGGHAGWASTALNANEQLEADNYFSLEPAYSSPLAVFGSVSFRSVAPFWRDPPDWTLREWQSSGICGAGLLIRKVRLRGGGQSFRIEDNPAYVTTHALEVKDATRALKKQRDQLNWSLPVTALEDLRAADVDSITWSPSREPRSPTVAPPGCAARGTR